MSRLARLAAVIAAALLLAAGCSGPHAPSTAPASTREDPHAAPGDLVRIIACFRQHGLADFPDAQYDPNDGRWHMPNNHPPITTQVLQACASVMPQSTPASPVPTAQLNDLLDFARCVRAHGLPDWPDPAVDGVFHTADPKADPAARAALGACDRYLASSGGQLNIGQPGG